MTLLLSFVCLRIALLAENIAIIHKLIIISDFFYFCKKKLVSSAATLLKISNMKNASDQRANFAFREKSGHSINRSNH